MININEYIIHFKPFAYRLNIEGKFEINSVYQIYPRTLIGKIDFPNQEITNVELIPDDKEICRKKQMKFCQVFKFSNFINLSSDKYFSRELDTEEDIPFQISFSFNDKNIPYFKSQNKIQKQEELLNFLQNLSFLKINSKLKYKNKFRVIRNKYESEHKTLEIPIQWNIHNGIQNQIYKKFFFKLPDYDNLRNKSIQQWFEIKNSSNTKIHHSKYEIVFDDGKRIEDYKLITTNNNHWQIYKWQGGFKKIKENYVRINSNSGIFFPQKESGILKGQIKLVTNNHGYSIEIQNHFSFNKDLIPNNTKLKILKKYDNYFKNLHKFKYINL